jgi:protein-L-isoaspartate(D-aspartate) O-methyltransferase
MVESQVRTNDVTDRRIIRAMLDLPRELFVPADQVAMAYRDEPIPVDAKGRFLLTPMLTARLIHLAVVEPEHRILEIGASTGYGTAILSRLAKRVVALEPDADLAAQARKTLAALDITNVEIVEGPLPLGWAAQAPYDRIVIAGSVAEIPQALQAQVNDAGRLVGVVGDAWHGKAMICEKVNAGWSQSLAFTIGAPVLPGFSKASVFAL